MPVRPSNSEFLPGGTPPIDRKFLTSITKPPLDERQGSYALGKTEGER